jgi:hypothetical protein
MRADLLLAALVLSANAAAQDLGTLFYSPQEREAMERLRRGEPAGQAAAPRREPVITGYVKRSDGKSTVFIDKRPYPARGARTQELLKPRIIERFEPMPLPSPPGPAAPAYQEDEETATEPARAPAAPPKSGKAG